MTLDSNDPPIQSQFAEQPHFRPPPEFVGQANAVDPQRCDRSVEEHLDTVGTDATLLDWDERWDAVLDDSNSPCHERFTGRTPAISHDCIDRLLAD